MKKTRWGILGTAHIASRAIIPALKASSYCELVAVASRDEKKGASFAAENGIPIMYGSYEQLLADPTIDVVYNPLPNHLHVEWTKKAVEAGKHVLCEKPLALSVSDVEDLIALRERSNKIIGEAYAVFHQERLQSLKQLIVDTTIGKLTGGHGCFYLDNRNPNDIRNAYQVGGGALWDIGVYPIVVGRWMFGEEPTSVFCTMELDGVFHVDYHTTGILCFPSKTLMSFSCGMRHPFHSAMTFYSEKHRIEVDHAFQSDTKAPMTFTVYDAMEMPAKRTYSYQSDDQYRHECDNFALSVLKGVPFAGSLEQTLANTRVLAALHASAQSHCMESV